MSLDQATNYAEIFASMATVLALVYLALEVRSNNRLQRAESRRSVLNHIAPLSIAIGQSSEASTLFYRGLVEFDRLTPSEQIQFEFLFSVLSSHTDLAFTDWRLGLSDADHFESSSRDFFNMLKSPGGRAYWARRSGNHAEEFQAFVVQKVYNGVQPEFDKGSNEN